MPDAARAAAGMGGVRETAMDIMTSRYRGGLPGRRARRMPASRWEERERARERTLSELARAGQEDGWYAGLWQAAVADAAVAAGGAA